MFYALRSLFLLGLAQQWAATTVSGSPAARSDFGLEPVPGPIRVETRYDAQNAGLSKAHVYDGAFSRRGRRDASRRSTLVAALVAAAAAVVVVLVILRCAKQIAKEIQLGSISRRLSAKDQCLGPDKEGSSDSDSAKQDSEGDEAEEPEEPLEGAVGGEGPKAKGGRRKKSSPGSRPRPRPRPKGPRGSKGYHRWVKDLKQFEGGAEGRPEDTPGPPDGTPTKAPRKRKDGKRTADERRKGRGPRKPQGPSHLPDPGESSTEEAEEEVKEASGSPSPQPPELLQRRHRRKKGKTGKTKGRLHKELSGYKGLSGSQLEEQVLEEFWSSEESSSEEGPPTGDEEEPEDSTETPVEMQAAAGPSGPSGSSGEPHGPPPEEDGEGSGAT